jgi:D-3-phosphoglycerate dehydrogenase / 2-oxoglutarate reductase
MFTVLVTDHPAPTTQIEADLLASVEARLLLAESGTEAELLALVPDADAILTCFAPVTPAVVRAGQRLRVIGRYGVGVDNIAVDVATERGIAVTNVPVYCVDEVAEHAIALLLTLARRTATYDASVRAGEWRLDVGAPLHRIAGSVLGVVGFGHIGRAITTRALGLGMDVLVFDHTTPGGDIRAAGAEPADLEHLLAESDAVSLHVPLNASTRHLIDRRHLALMKPGAFLINCARGAIVDLDALAEAIGDERLAGAGLDVFDPERLPIDHPLLALKNVVLTPHVAFYSEESVAELQRRATANVIDALTGKIPASVVNPSVTSLHPSDTDAKPVND